MRTVTNHFFKITSIILLSSVLLSCSKDYNAFLHERNAQTEKGYIWKRLDACRPPQIGSQAITILTGAGKPFVCFTLTPPDEPQIAKSQPTLQNIKTDKNTNISQPSSTDNTTNTGGIIWEFTNF